MRISFIIISLFLLSGCETLDYVSVGGHSNNYNSHYNISHHSNHNYFGYDYSYYSPYTNHYRQYYSHYNYGRYYTPYPITHRHLIKHQSKKNHNLRDRRKHDRNIARPRRP